MVAPERSAEIAVGVYGSSRYRARVSAFLRELRWYRESYFVLSFVQGFFYGMKEM